MNFLEGLYQRFVIFKADDHSFQVVATSLYLVSVLSSIRQVYM